jgi:hypothetical protein
MYFPSEATESISRQIRPFRMCPLRRILQAVLLHVITDRERNRLREAASQKHLGIHRNKVRCRDATEPRSLPQSTDEVRQRQDLENLAGTHLAPGLP